MTVSPANFLIDGIEVLIGRQDSDRYRIWPVDRVFVDRMLECDARWREVRIKNYRLFDDDFGRLIQSRCNWFRNRRRQCILLIAKASLGRLMKYYFNLQYTMLKRHLVAFGVHPVLGMCLVAVVFLGLSLLLFTRTSCASYIYAFFALVSVSRASQWQRNDVLKGYFSKEQYVSVRLIENALLVLPFSLFLIFKGEAVIAALTFFAALLLFLLTGPRLLSYSIPTPFAKRPFEFIVGFRSTFVVVCFAYFLMIMALIVDNYNLGVFALGVVILTSLTYYGTLEHAFYVWIFSCSPKQFLWKKIKTSWLQLTVLCIPILICHALFYPFRFHVILLILCLGFLYLTVMILAKYAAYPNAVNLPQSILIAAGFWLPPLLIGIIPFFYKRALNQLQT